MRKFKNTDNLVFSFLLLILFLFSGYVFFHDLSKNTPFYPDEALYSLMDVRTLNNPSDLVFAKPNDDLPFYYKPPLKSLMKYAVLKTFGVNGFTLRVLDAIMGFLTIGIIFLIGYRLYNKWAGIFSAFIMLTFAGLYTDYWARVNAYDAGIVFGTSLFFYLFLYKYQKRLGWLWCGLALSFCFYFKHIMTFLILFIAIVYLLINEGFKGVLNRRFFLMLMTLLVLILAWHIPFFLNNPEAFNYFLSYEISKRIFTGYSGQRGYSNPEYVLSSIWEKTGVWNFLIIPGIIIVLSFLIIKKKREHLLVLLWFLIPLSALIISASRLSRYMFPFYPPIALMIGYSSITMINAITKQKYKKSNKILFIARYSAFAIFSLFLTVLSFKAVESTVYAVQPIRRENFHVITELLKMQAGGKMYFAESDLTNYSWEEQVILEFVKERIIFLKSNHEIKEQINNIQKEDVIILFKWKLTNLLFSEKESGIQLTKVSYIDIPLKIARYSSTKKVAIFKDRSLYADYFGKHNVNVQKFEKLESYHSNDNLKYIKNLLNISIGAYKNNKDIRYYADAIHAGSITREELVQRCECYSRYFNLKKMPTWTNKNDKLNFGKKGFHYLVDFYNPNRQGTLYMIGINRDSFTDNMYCYFLKTEYMWKFIPGNYPLEKILTTLKSNDVAILTEEHLMQFISDLSKKISGIAFDKTKRSDDNPRNMYNYSKYVFFNIKKNTGPSEVRRQYPNLVGIVREDGDLFAYINSHNIQFLPVNR